MQTSLQGLRPRRMNKSFQELRAKACRVFRVSKDDFKNSKFRESVHARSYVAHYLRTKKNASWQKIGMLLNRYHKTVVYIVRAWPENYKIARTYIKGGCKSGKGSSKRFLCPTRRFCKRNPFYKWGFSLYTALFIGHSFGFILRLYLGTCRHIGHLFDGMGRDENRISLRCVRFAVDEGLRFASR